MERVRSVVGNAALAVVAALHLHLHLHLFHLHLHRFHGSPIDYSALAAAAFASFFGVPGPGEPVLVAAAILAAQHRLDLFEVLLVAFGGAVAGGVTGWLAGRYGGRALMVRPGPLLRVRRTALARGEEMFERRPVLAIVLTPPWVAGITHVGVRRFLAVNAASAVVWAGGIGLAAWAAGPVVVDWVGDLGTVLGVALVVLIAAAVVETRRRGRRRRGRGTD